MYFPDLRLQERQSSRAPCPNGNGTMIGGEQQFVVYCDTRFRGNEVLRQKADSLAACAEMCTSFQNPRCEGVQFKDNRDCVLLGDLVPDRTRPSRFFDSAAAVFPQPGPTSSCSQQGTGTTFLGQGSSFTLQCGTIVNGNDLEQQFQMTLESCLAACSANPVCGGVTFDPQQTSGFKNCYLKTTIDTSNVFAKAGVDSAVLVNNADQAANGNIPASTSTSTSTSAIAIASAPSDPVSQTTAFVTVVPNQGTASGNVVTVSVPVPVISTSSTSALADSTTEASAGAASTGTDNGRGGVSNNERPKFGGIASSNSSNAWIAAPVIGGIAALTLVLAVFVLWGRRRRRENSPPRDGTPGPMSRATLGNFGRGLGDAAGRLSRGRVFGSEKTRLGSSDLDDDSRYGTNRGGFKVVSGSGRRLGLNGREIPGTGPGLGGMIVTAGRGKVVTVNTGSVRSSSPASSAGLRDSQNGLRQNRLTGNWLDLPAEFRGPDLK